MRWEMSSLLMASGCLLFLLHFSGEVCAGGTYIPSYEECTAAYPGLKVREILIAKAHYMCARAVFLGNLLKLNKLSSPKVNVTDYWTTSQRCPQCLGDFPVLMNNTAPLPYEQQYGFLYDWQSLFSLRPSKCVTGYEFCSNPRNATEDVHYPRCNRIFCFFNPGNMCRAADDQFMYNNRTIGSCLSKEEFRDQHQSCPIINCLYKKRSTADDEVTSDGQLRTTTTTAQKRIRLAELLSRVVHNGLEKRAGKRELPAERRSRLKRATCSSFDCGNCGFLVNDDQNCSAADPWNRQMCCTCILSSTTGYLF